MDNVNKIINCISNYKYISFDIFDTLLVRNIVKNETIFDIVGKRAFDYGIIKDNLFFNERKIAQDIASKKANNAEFSLQDIYNNINCYSEEQKEKLMELEVLVEKTMIQINKELFEVYLWCKKNNKYIIATSDMYLDSSVINEILQENNIYVDKLYVSSEIGKNKRTGTIFNYILKDLKLCKNELIHIGDNFKSDYIMPQFNGVRSFYYKKEKSLYGDLQIQEEVMYRVIQNNKENDPYFNIGMKILGPLLLGFCEWLNNKKKEDKIDQFIFLSRDGKIMKKAYDILYNEDTYYMNISRRTLNVSTLWLHPEYNEVKNYIVISKEISLEIFLFRLGMNKNEIEIISQNYDFDFKKLYNYDLFWNMENTKLVYEDNKQFLINNSKKQYNYFTKYLKKYTKKSNIGIVDIGWRGSMQNSLAQIVKSDTLFKDISIKGYYVGVEKKDINYNGFLYSSGVKCEEKMVIDASVGLIETLFLDIEGTTLSYYEKKGEIYPEIDTYENEKYNDKIKKIHDGALFLISKLKELGIFKIEKINKQIALNNYKKTALFPTKSEINLFEEFIFNDSNNSKLIKKRGFKYYCFHYKRLFRDFKNSMWKIGFLKCNMGMHLPWGYIYKNLKKRNG